MPLAMTLAKYRYVPAPEPTVRSAPRLADDSDAYIASPVHKLQSGLTQLQEPNVVIADDRYPGWFRLSFPVAVSGLLWATILWAVGWLN
jgi:hypothetical protein